MNPRKDLLVNIAFVARESFPPVMKGQVGGIGRYTETMSSGLSALGARVFVIAQSSDSRLGIDNVNGVTVVRLPKWEQAFFFSWRLNSLEAKFLKTTVGRELWSDLSDKIRRALIVDRYMPTIQDKLGVSFDVVEFPECGAEGLFHLARRNRPCSIVRIHCPTQLLIQNNFDRASFGKRMLVRLERIASHCGDTITSPSNSAAGLAQGNWKLTNKKPSVISNLFDDRVFMFKNQPRNNRKFTILYTGRLERLKGVMHFPGILSKLNELGVDFQVRFAGRDTDTAPGSTSMQAWLQDSFDGNLKDRVEFLGQLDEHDLVNELNSADVGLYLSGYETFGYTALEAQACGLPVIASRHGGMGEVVLHDRTGFLVDQSDHDAIADRIHALYREDDLRVSMGVAAARHAMEKYSIRNGCQEFLRFYEAVAAAGRLKKSRAIARQVS